MLDLDFQLPPVLISILLHPVFVDRKVTQQTPYAVRITLFLRVYHHVRPYLGDVPTIFVARFKLRVVISRSTTSGKTALVVNGHCA